jgi:hypothetical protein
MCTFAFWCHISTYLADECFAICIQTVLPKQGRALLWPSVKDDSPNVEDGRTDHQALPVEAGIKYGTCRNICNISKFAWALFNCLHPFSC